MIDDIMDYLPTAVQKMKDIKELIKQNTSVNFDVENGGFLQRVQTKKIQIYK